MLFMILLKDRSFKLLLTRHQIRERIYELATEIDRDYKQSEPLFLVILNGAFVFAADLLREMSIFPEIGFIRLSSYKNTKSTGAVTELFRLHERIENRDIVIVEDIVDTGLTLQYLFNMLRKEGANSWEIVSLLSRATNPVGKLKIKYLGFDIPDKFVVGYGLDYAGFGRNLKDIYQLV